MIARAIAPKPRILFFDEATSALDNVTQKKISNLSEFSYFFDAIEWFRTLIFIFPNSRYNDIRRLTEKDSRDRLNKLMKYFDTGIESVESIERPIEDVFVSLPGGLWGERKYNVSILLWTAPD